MNKERSEKNWTTTLQKENSKMGPLFIYPYSGGRHI